jgi:putative nucleotidyltransferase with HDIG domain
MIKLSPEQQRRIYMVLLLIVSASLILVAVLSPLLQSSLARMPQEGEIAREDYRAPIALTFSSEVLTEQRREVVERAVVPIYSSPDTRVARRQLEQLRSTLAYINSVRADTFASLDQKLTDLSALDDITLNPETAETILSMTDARWQEVQQEAISVLEKVMSSAIRPENLVDATSGVPALVTLSLPEEQAAIVAELAVAYVAPNSQYSENLTMAARQEARDSVQPVTRSFVPGQTIALQGEVLGADDVEALQQLGLTEAETNTQDLVSATILSLLLLAFTGIFLSRKKIPDSGEPRYLGVLAALMLGFLIIARLVLPTNPLIAYAFPLASCSLVIAALFGTETALVMTIPLSILVAFGLPNALELTFFYLISGLFGALALGRARRLITFLWAGLAVAVSGIVVVLVFRLPQPSSSLQTLATIGAAAFFNGLVSASLSILLHSVLAPLLGMLTPVQLLDLTRPDHPLLGLLLRDAPGTYQHSLQVANLAEQAAERIKIDPLLIRAGALYHDIGKACNPFFFIENQPPGFENPHNKLEPEESARVIISHVTDGLKLARKYRLARRIMDFIAEHHGTAITSYQYFNAVKIAGGDESLVEKEPYRYPGPRPQSKETGVLMLADACEARVRAERPSEEETLRALIKNVINGRVSSGQLDETQLSLRDLNELADSFTVTLRGIYHPRINYPNQDTQVSPDAITIPIRKKVGASSEADVR